jgi:hypothetical protein
VANPWTKKNPFMSMWLSGANAVTGKARSLGAAEAARQRTQVARAVTRLWTDAWFGTAAPKSKTRRKTR